MMRVVFSYTACHSSKLSSLCIDCGVDAVVSSHKELEQALEVLFFPTPLPVILSSGEVHVDDTTASELFLSSITRTAVFVSSVPLLQRRQREQHLYHLAGERTTYRLTKSRRRTKRLEQYQSVTQEPPPPTPTPPPTPPPPPPETKSPNVRVRVVHVSDTHNMHRQLTRRLVLPSGDLFLHTGDIVGNYRHNVNLRAQLQDFLEWIHLEVCPRFDQVVLLAGNHDTLLDETSAKYDPNAQEFLVRFLEAHHPKVAYLKDSAIVYKDLLIYGSPTCPSRVETMNKWYLSHGFERTIEERKELWKKIPENVDILLTHVPPADLEGYELNETVTGAGCEILAKEVYKEPKRRRFPLLHAFGHIHSYFGVTRHQGTTLSNGSQGDLLCIDPFGGGTPLVFDLCMPDPLAPGNEATKSGFMEVDKCL
jgi:hypothetical protein